jgi:hypothetical protein
MERAPGNMPALRQALGIDDPRLAALRADFPQFRIWAETIGQRHRYIARRLDAGTRPHTVVTPDLDELRTALVGEPAISHQAEIGGRQR